MNRIKKELTLDEKYSWDYVRQALTQVWEREHRAVTIISICISFAVSTCLLSKYIVEVIHMSGEEYKKQQDIKIIVELLKQESPERVRDVLIFIQSYLSK